MTKNLAKHFVLHGYVGLAPHVVAELSLNHHHRGLDIAPLAVMPEELLPIEREVMKHLFPSSTMDGSALGASRIGLEWNVGTRESQWDS